MPAPPLQVVWFKRDLRLADHRPLAAAARRGPVLPLFVIETDYWREPDTSARQYEFMAETVSSLRADLARLGQPLVVRIGAVVTLLEHLRRRHGIAALWSHEETGNAWTCARDRAVAAWARAHGIDRHEVRQDGVVRRLRDRDGWARRWDGVMAEPLTEPPAALAPIDGIEPGPIPSAAALGLPPDPCPERQRGGRALAEARLDSFLLSRGRTYRRDMSSPLAGATACSRLSADLAWGALSMREVAQATSARQRDLRTDPDPAAADWRASLISFAGRLHWHCHFMQKLESEPAIEWREFHPAMRGLRPEPADAVRLAAWTTGQTGFPFLDACLRALAATGWLNFRMRAMVMSFASYNLWLPWRPTGLHLARQFTDYEPGIHWPQVQMQSGTTGINTIRIYSVVKQGHDQDPTGIFTRRWVPELASVPDRFLQEPWRWEGAGTLLGSRYPERIVDLAASTAAAKRHIFGLRGSREFHAAADAIQERHGSRRSGLAMTGQRRPRRRRSTAAPPAQLEFDV
jgi:deoxyribodipyrimidine photo-lyase